MICLTKGYKCDGYAVSKSKKSFSAAHLAAQQAQQNAWPARYDSPSLLPDMDPHEQRYFDIFCKYTIPQLAGGFESPFWQTFIPRASYQIPCVRHAAIALAALHEDFTKERDIAATTFPNPASDSSFTMNQYGRALQSLLNFVRQSGDNATEIVLSVCVLFICFEIIRGNHNAVLLHTQSGMNLLTDAITKMSLERSKKSSPVPLSAISPVFTRIDVQASDIMDSAPFERYANFTKPLEPMPVPTVFESLVHAKQSILEHQNYFMYKIREVVRHYGYERDSWPPDEQARLCKLKEQYTIILDQWYTAHNALAKKENLRGDNSTHHASNILLVHYHLLQISLYKFPSLDEMIFDRFTSIFENIVAAAKAAFTSTTSHDHPTEHMTLSFDLGLAEPLFYVVTRCRVPRVRREALALLKQCPSNEGIWNSSLAARLGEEIIDLEHRASPSWPHITSAADIPQGSRMRKGEPKFVKETGELSFTFTDMYGNRCRRRIDWSGPQTDMLLASRAKPDWAMGRWQRSVQSRLRLKINTAPRPRFPYVPSEVATWGSHSMSSAERNSFTDMTDAFNVYDAALSPGTTVDASSEVRTLPPSEESGAAFSVSASVEDTPPLDGDVFVGWE